jgi:hypothetical protein
VLGKAKMIFAEESYVVWPAQSEREKSRSPLQGIGRPLVRRADLIVRDTASGMPTEYAAAEVANKFEGEYSEKWPNETKLKLPKMLRDTDLLMVAT